MADVIYNSFKNDVLSGSMNLSGDTFKLMLVTASYVPDEDADTKRSHVTNEASGTGYSSGGATVSGITLTQDDLNDKIVVDGADVSWPASTITARGAVLYKSTGSAATDPLVAYFDFGTDRSSSNGTFTVAWNATGILELE